MASSNMNKSDAMLSYPTNAFNNNNQNLTKQTINNNSVKQLEQNYI